MTSRHLPDCPCGACPRPPARNCGCVRNVRWCDEATRLWDAVADAYKADKDGGSFRHFSVALEVFEAHFTTEPEPAEQAALL